MSAKRYAFVLAALMALAACGGDNGDTGGTGSPTTPAPTTPAPGGRTTIAVTLQEWAVLPDAATAPAGSVTFAATNTGPNDPHELVVVKTDLDPGSLPVNDDGSVNEAGSGIEIIGEIAEFPVGETREQTFDLEAGSYALMCNLVEVEMGQTESHYRLGMRTAFTVS